MNNAEMKIVYFDERDVIATSGLTVKLSNIGNNNVNDNALYLGNDTTTNYYANIAGLNSVFGANLNDAIKFYYSDTQYQSIKNINANNDNKISEKSGTNQFEKYNTTYVWDSIKNGFIKQ